MAAKKKKKKTVIRSFRIEEEEEEYESITKKGSLSLSWTEREKDKRESLICVGINTVKHFGFLTKTRRSWPLIDFSFAQRDTEK